MDTKPIKPKRENAFEPEEVSFRDQAAADGWADAWIARNRDQIDRDIAEARKSLAEGKGKRYSAGAGEDEFVKDAMAALRKRKRKRAPKR